MWKLRNLANFFTFLRVGLIPLVLLAFFYGYNLLTILLWLTLSLCDFLDGFFARFLRQESELGAKWDPIADKLAVLSLLFFINWRGLCDFNGFLGSLLILWREIVINSLRASSSIKVQLLGKIKTFLQLIVLLFFIVEQGEMANFLLFLVGVFTFVSGFFYLK